MFFRSIKYAIKQQLHKQKEKKEKKTDIMINDS